MEHTYKVKYKVEFGEFTREELGKDDSGGCDSIAILSIMGRFGNGEPLSMVPIGVHSKDERWSTLDWYEALGFLASFVQDSRELPPEKQEIVDTFFESYRQLKLKET